MTCKWCVVVEVMYVLVVQYVVEVMYVLVVQYVVVGSYSIRSVCPSGPRG